MSSVDSRIVTMKFDNAQFQQGAATTMSTLDKLKQSLNFTAVGGAVTKSLGFISGALAKFGIKNPFSTAEKGVADLGKAAQQVSGPAGLGSIEGGVTHVSKSFLAMSTVAITALATITSKAMQAGAQFAKAFTTEPIKAGLAEYETGLNSVQTILSNTKASGATLKDVNATLKELNTYSDQTIYNFQEMARNIGTFTAAGVDLKTATGSIKGIANLAALSGSNSQQAATAMYQLSQEISAGRVSLMGWNSVVNAGMGGTVFQRALAETAVAMGEIDASAVKLTGKMKNVKIEGKSFRDSIMAKPGEQSWLSSKVLTNTLRQFTGDLSDAELAAQGFSKAQIKAIQDQAKTAKDAATKVKTMTQLIDVAKETAQSGWAQTWQVIFGNFTEAKKTFTDASNAINGVINASANARNKLFTDWKELGGRTAAIDGIRQGFIALQKILVPIREAFRDVFPPMTGKRLLEITNGFKDFMTSLVPTVDTVEALFQTFRGVFAIFDIGKQIIAAIAHQIGRLFSAMADGSGGFLSFTAGIGDTLYQFDKMLKKTGLIDGFFQALGNIIAIPLDMLRKLAGYIGDIFTGFDSSGASKIGGAFESISDRISPLESAGERLSVLFSAVGDIAQKAGQLIGDAMVKVGDAIATAFGSENFDKTLDTLNTALLGGILLTLKNFFSGNKIGIEVGGSGFFDTVKDTLEGVTDTLTTMQASVKSDILMKIAGALAIMTASVVALALIDSGALTKALTAMVVGFTVLGGALVALNTAIGIIGAAKLPLITGSLVALSGAMLLMAAAVKIFESMSLGDMIRGMVGFAGTLFIMTKAVEALSKNSGSIIRSSAALLILGVAMNVMAGALKLMSMLSWEEMGRGLAGVAGSLVVLAAAMRIMPKGMLLQATAITVLSVALSAMGGALKIFASLNWEEMARGLVTLAGALVIIAGAMQIMPKGMLLQATALIAVGTALNLIGIAVSSMGGMTWEEIAKGLVTLAGSLVILAGGLYLMTGSLAGAAALVVAAAALAVMTPVLIALGAMSWEAIAKGLVALAGAFTVLGLAGLVLAPLTPVIMGLSVAVLLIGGGFALAGAGALAFAAAFGIVVAAGAAGVKIIGSVIAELVRAIPGFFKSLAQGIIKFAQIMANSGPTFVKVMATLLSSMLRAVIQNIPLIGKAFTTLVDTALRVLVNAVPKMVSAGMKILLGVLQGIRNNISQIINVATDVVVKFINGIAKNIGRVIEAGVNLIIKFINGVANAIDAHASELGAAGGRLASAIVTGMAKGIWGGLGAIKDAAMGVAKGALNAAKDFLGIHSPSKEFEKIGKWSTEGFKIGLVGGTSDVREAMQTMTSTLKEEMEKQKDAIKDEQSELDKLLDSKDRDEKAIAKTRKRLAAAQEMYAAAKSAREAFSKDVKSEREQLIALSKDYDMVTEKIENAKKALDDAIKARDDAAKSITDQYSSLPDITEETTVEDYTNALRTEATKTATFLESLNKLVDMGLDDETYQKLLDEGVGIQPFIDQLIAGGPQAVEAVDQATIALGVAAKNLGDRASIELYQAGVDSAQGLLDGLKSQKAAIKAEMEEIAALISKTIRKELKIKSPSRVMMEVGRYVNEGLAQGMNEHSVVVAKSGESVAQTALDAIKDTMAKASGSISSELDTNPRITPVLDLTQLKKGASSIGGVLNPKALSASVSYGQAAAVSKSRGVDSMSPDTTAVGETKVFKFEQNNYSPKTLSAVEIYRQTKSQLALAKEALNA